MIQQGSELVASGQQQVAEIASVQELLRKFEELRAQARELGEEAVADLAVVRAFAIASDGDKELAAKVIGEIKGKLADVERRRRAVTDPLNSLVRWVNDWFRPAKDARAEGERLLKQGLAVYIAACTEANRRALAEAARAETPLQAHAALAQVSSPALPRGTTARQVWKFEVVDPDQVPREFCSPDPSKIGRHFSPTGEPAPIPGVRWFQETIVSSRRT